MSKKIRKNIDEYELTEELEKNDIIPEIDPVVYMYHHNYKFKYKCNHCGNRVGDDVYQCSSCGSYDIVKIEEK